MYFAISSSEVSNNVYGGSLNQSRASGLDIITTAAAAAPGTNARLPSVFEEYQSFYQLW